MVLVPGLSKSGMLGHACIGYGVVCVGVAVDAFEQYYKFFAFNCDKIPENQHNIII